MKKPFTFSDDMLGILLKSYSNWSQGQKEQKEYPDLQRQRTEDLKKTLLNPKILSKMSDDELFQAIFEHSRSLEGPAHIHLGQPRISKEQEKVRKNLIYFVESMEDPFKKAASILVGENKISHFAKAFWTPIFQAQYPKQLPNWNNKTNRFFKKLGISLNSTKRTVEQNYKLLSDAFLYLQEVDPSQDVYSLNHLMHYGIAIKEGVDLMEKMTGGNGPKPPVIGGQTHWRIIEPFDTKEINVWQGCKSKGIIAIGYLTKPDAPAVKTMREKMGPGDKVVAYLTNNRVGGIGTVVGEYEDYTDEKPKEKDHFEGNFWRRRKVKWDHLPTEGEYWKLTEKMPGGRGTLSRLSKQQFDRVRELVGIKEVPRGTITKEELLKEVFLDEARLEQILALLLNNNDKRQIILQGPPGTGKTFIAGRIGRFLAGSEDNIDVIQFHPSYSYEDFIEGYRPDSDGTFQLRAGIFKTFCEKARKEDGKDFVLIVDEINRGNLSKIFGELLYLLEYRDQQAKLTYSSESFSIPKNLCIIGTMNTADRSLAMMDYALRRRFYFVDLKCETERLGSWLKENNCKLDVDGLLQKIDKINGAIENEMGSADFAIGHSYFMKQDLDLAGLQNIIRFEIKPLLEEYFFDKKERVHQVLGNIEEYGL